MRRLGATLMLVAAGCSDPIAPPAFGDTGTTGTDSGSTVGDEAGSSDETGEPLPPLPPLGGAPLTDEQTIVPSHPVDGEHELDPRVPADLDALLADGFGEVEAGPGEALTHRTLDASEPPAPGPNPQLLTRFVHLADSQLLDDESPLRATSIDSAGFPYPFRANEAYACRVLNAAVRTINAVHGVRPLDYVVLGGDNVDSAQQNEVEWFLGIMDGAPSVHCDSGTDDDPVPGPDNDPKDPFGPVTLDVPWRWVTGNHDILVQGVFVQLPGHIMQATGSEAPAGTRDWSQPGGPVVEGEIVPDERRALLHGTEVLARVAASGDGHGLGPDVLARPRAHYTFDAGDVRIMVIESATNDGATDGVILDGDVSDFIRPELDQAQAEGRPVIVVSHHASTQLSNGGGLGGSAHDDALQMEDWEALLAEYPIVLMHLAGHIHHHRIRAIAPMGGTPYWEVLTGALADYPHQMRLVEVHDQDNGFYSITGIAIDFSTDGDTLAAESRARGVADLTSAWLEDGSGTPDERNVVLWVPK